MDKINTSVRWISFGIALLMVFALGFASSLAYDKINPRNPDTVYVIGADEFHTSSEGFLDNSEDSPSLIQLMTGTASERASPSDWIKEDQIHVYPDRIVIDLSSAEWSTFTDTNSMDPVIDKGANAIEVVPKSPDQIGVGDIIAYDTDLSENTIIHRVVEIGFDSEGWYAKVKGDNLSQEDPEKVRFSQVKRVVVAVIY